MRISRRKGAVLALVAAGSLVVGGIAFAAADGNISTLSFKFTPKKVPKKKFKKGSIFVHTTTLKQGDPSAQPVATKTVKLDFDDDFKFNTGSVGRCGTSLSGLTPSQALAACGADKVGTGSSTVRGGSPPDLPACVLAFNGKKDSSGHPVILLHTAIYSPLASHQCSDTSNNTGFVTSVVLTGKLTSSPIGGDFGKRLNVAVPPTGNSIIDFQTTVKRGKYVAARCHDRNHKWNMKGKFIYQDNQSDTVRASQRCKVG